MGNKNSGRKQIKITYDINENGCWICTSHIGGNYPRCHRDGKMQNIGRYLYEKRYGLVKNKELIMCHKCDNKKCINPEHIEFATQSKNINDAYLRNRMVLRIGKNHHNLKISDEDVIYIRKMRGKIKQKVLAEQFDIRDSTISRIQTNKRRIHVKMW